MKTLVIKASGVIANPQYGKVSDLPDGLRLLLDMREALSAYNEGDEVNYLHGGLMGYASDAEKEFTSSSWGGYPTKDSSLGFAALKFEGEHGITQDIEVTPQTEEVGDSTYVLVYKAEEGGGVSSRLFGEKNVLRNNRFNAFQPPYPDNKGVLRTGNDVSHTDTDNNSYANDSIGFGTYTLRAAIIVFNGSESFIIHSDDINNTEFANVNHSTNTNISLGINHSAPSQGGTQFHGYLGYFAQYNRPFREEEARTHLLEIAQEFGV